MSARDSSKKEQPLPSEASYICSACGEVIVIPVDVSAGESQDYVEDCPVCCRPHELHVAWDSDGNVHVTCDPE